MIGKSVLALAPIQLNMFRLRTVTATSFWSNGGLRFCFHLCARPEHRMISTIQPGLHQVIIMRASKLPRLPWRMNRHRSGQVTHIDDLPERRIIKSFCF